MALLHHPGVHVLVAEKDDRKQALVAVAFEHLQRDILAEDPGVEGPGRRPAARLDRLRRVDVREPHQRGAFAQLNLNRIAVDHARYDGGNEPVLERDCGERECDAACQGCHGVNDRADFEQAHPHASSRRIMRLCCKRFDHDIMALMTASTHFCARLFGACAVAILSSLAARAMAGPESTPESAQPATSVAPEVELGPVTVEARRRRELIDKQVSEFVYSVAGPGLAESLARWNVPVCVATAGLTAAEADFVTKRIAQIATDADVPMGGPACGPNFAVIVTTEPEKLLKEWWSEEHRLFNRDRGVGGVNRFIQTDQPVRVWHNACNAPSGIPAHAFSTSQHCASGSLTGSRLSWSAVRAIYTAIVVVDLEQIEGLTFGQVADYVAMVGLAQIRPNQEMGEVPTILDLFAMSGMDRSKGMTEWDQSFLKAVYATTDGSTTEISLIKVRMSEELAR